ncbi:MAG: HlyD family efflux transporter periplasmic adaptor subunit [Pseudomonadota bacterium]
MSFTVISFSSFSRPIFWCLLVMTLAACTEGESNLALGTLERDRITLSATAAEIIIEQPVAEGSHVQTGDLLVQLDATLQLANIAKIQGDLAQLHANLAKLNNGARPEEISAATARLETANALLQESERDFQRITGIAERGLAARADLETAESLRDTNAARVREAEAQLQLLRAGSRIEDINLAQAQIQSAEALLQSEQQKLNNLSVVATRAGTLDSLPWNTGERVATGAQLAVLLSDDPPYARVYIPEQSRAAINTGDNLVVHVDGVDTAFTGTVRWIALEPAFTPYYTLTSSERSRLVYLAEVALPAEASDLPAGLPAQVELPQ